MRHSIMIMLDLHGHAMPEIEDEAARAARLLLARSVSG
jgi:hypothetical protein